MTVLLERPIPQAIVRPKRRSIFMAYVALTKPRVIELLLVTTLPTMMLAAQGLPPLRTAVATLVCGALAAGSANALNCYFDRDIDAVMRRTSRRPLAQHSVSPPAAFRFGVIIGVLSVGALWWLTNALAAALTLAAILFYVLVYTLTLKRRTPQNIVWGGAAGAMPVLIGWSAVTGGLDWRPALLFMVIFLWTPIHYWPLAMRFRDDYAKVGVPMLPVVASPLAVVRRIVAYGWATVVTSLALWPLALSWVYGVIALGAGSCFLIGAHQLLGDVQRGVKARPIRLFHLSNSYLALIFTAVALDSLIMA